MAIAVLLPRFENLGGIDFITAVFVSDCVALLAGIGLWIAFGYSSLRFLYSVIGLIAITVLLQIGQGPFNFSVVMTLMTFTCVVVAVVAVPVWLIRLIRRGSLVQIDSGEDEPSELPVEVLQFSIRHIFTLTTAFALVAAFWKFILSNNANSGAYYDETLLLICLGTTLGLSSVVAVWATLGRETFYRTIYSLVAATCLGMASTLLVPNDVAWLYVLISLAVWLQITLLMWTLRLDGLRFFVANSE